MILATVFPVFFIIALGWLFAKVKHINLGAVSEIILYITTPCLIFSFLIKNQVVMADFLTIALSVLAVTSGCGLATWILLRLSHLDCRGLYLPVMFMNAGNMALPLALLASGPRGLSRAVLYYVISDVLSYSLGVMLVSPHGHLSEVFRLPLIYAAILGILFGVFRVPLSPALIKPFQILGGAAIPLMLLSLGYRLHLAKMSSPQVAMVGASPAHWPRIWPGLLFRLPLPPSRLDPVHYPAFFFHALRRGQLHSGPTLRAEPRTGRLGNPGKQPAEYRDNPFDPVILHGEVTP